MKTLTKQNKGCFVKLSSRSPKDVTMGEYPKTQQIYQEIMNSPKIKNFLISLDSNEENSNSKSSSRIYSPNQQLIINEKLKALYKASTEAMKVDTAEEALHLFLSSRRIYWDLQYALEFPESFDIQLIFREWKNIPLQYEFRAFVYNNKLTAISQYFTQLYFPSLIRSKQIFQEKIQEFWFSLKDRLSTLFHQDDVIKYVIDFACVVNNDDNNDPGDFTYENDFKEVNVVLLELNPFNISTGSGLFSWEEEKDCDIMEGLCDFEFRVIKNPISHTLRNKLHLSWQNLLFDC